MSPDTISINKSTNIKDRADKSDTGHKSQQSNDILLSENMQQNLQDELRIHT